jgi:hypothetical protein
MDNSSQLMPQNGFVYFSRSPRVASTLEAKKARDDGKAKIDATDLLFAPDKSSGGLTVSSVNSWCSAACSLLRKAVMRVLL